MRSLLDASVLIALIDPKHAFNSRAHTWWANNANIGWSSCPLTENALIRIMSNPNYDRLTRFYIANLAQQLRELTEKTDHQFWPDDISIADASLFNIDRILGPSQITDVYLLAVAVRNGGRLVTFDGRISTLAVRNASAANLCII